MAAKPQTPNSKPQTPNPKPQTPNPEEIETECSVCHELFTEPKLLPCAHVLCRQCLLSCLSTSMAASCPLCRHAIGNHNHQTAEEWQTLVDALPTDVAMTTLVQSTRVLSQFHTCEGCHQSIASSICLCCCNLLCESCTAVHNSLRATRYHKVKQLSNLTAEQLSVSKPAICHLHSNETSSLFCSTHSIAVCHLCASSEHRSCPEMVLLEKRVEELRTELAGMLDRLKSMEENLENSINKLEKHLQQAQHGTELSLAEIDQACDRLENSVKLCRHRLKKLAQNALKQVEDSVEKIAETSKGHGGAITSHRRFVDRVKRASPPTDLEGAANVLRSRIKDLECAVTSKVKPASIKILKIDFQTVQRLEKELSCLGEERVVSSVQPEIKGASADLDAGNDVSKLYHVQKQLAATRSWSGWRRKQTTHIQSIDKKSSLGGERTERWTFFRCENILFSNNDMSGEKTAGQSVFLMSKTPMSVNKLYEIRIDKIHGKSGDFLPCGIINKHPASVNLPKTALDGWKDAVVFSYNVFKFGEEKKNNINKRLQSLKEGTRVGFLRDSGGFLHLYIDGKRQWVYIRNMFCTCYVFFELLHIYRKVTTLPVTFVKKEF